MSTGTTAPVETTTPESAPVRIPDVIPAVRAPGWMQTAQFLARPDRFLESNWERHGDVFTARIHGFGTGRHLVLAHHDLVEQVYKGSPKALRLGEVARKPVTPIAGPHSLLALDQPEHLRHRKLLLPPFHGQRMLAYAGIMEEATQRSLERWPIDTPFPLRPRMADITLEVVMRAVFGVERGERYDELTDVLLRMIENKLPVSLALVFPPLRRDLGPIHAWSDMTRAKARAGELLYAEITERRRPGATEGREDILSMLVDARDADGQGMSDDEIHDELITMLLAGHETTASALAWTFDLLLHHPEVLRRLRIELQAGQEDYLDAVVSESLRLRPVVATSQRVVSEPIEIGGHEVELGTTILCAIWLIHRRADLYPEPLSFRPERFLGQRPPTYEWIPFGGGVRRCIGANFAPMEMRTVLRHIILNAELDPASPDLERPHNRVVLLAPRNGTMAIRRAR